MQTDLHPACTRLHVPILAGADCEISWRAQTKGHAKSDAADEHEVDQSATVGLASAPGAPKKPASAYIHFCNEVRSQLKTSRPDIDPKDLMKALGEQWAATTDKVQYEALAKKDADRCTCQRRAWAPPRLICRPPRRYAKECSEAGIDAETQPLQNRSELECSRTQNRFHQMVQEMERKYATARPLQRSKRKPDGKTAGSKAKVARANVLGRAEVQAASDVANVTALTKLGTDLLLAGDGAPP